MTEEDLKNRLPEKTSDAVTFEDPFNPAQRVNYDEVRATVARFSTADWFKKMTEQTVIIGGQGGISSWLTLLVARMRPTAIYTFDPDTVETVNLAGQFFGMRDAEKTKVDAVANSVKNYANYFSIFASPERYTEDTMAGPVMLCGFDNMAARKVFYNNWKQFVRSMPEDKRNTAIFIDGRLSAEVLQIYCIVGDADWDMEYYEKNCLFDDSEAIQEVCSFKQTAFVANMIGALMTNLLVNFCANLSGGCRSVPFFTSYEADQMYLKEEGGV